MENNASNDKQPEVNFLRGDEVVLFANGKIGKAVSHLLDNSVTKIDSNSLRDAIAIWQAGETPDRDSLSELPKKSAVVREKINQIHGNLFKQVDDAHKHEYTLLQGIPRLNKQDRKVLVKRAEGFNKNKMSAILPNLQKISKVPDKWLEKEDVVAAFANNPSLEDSLVSKEDFLKEKEKLLQNSVFTPELKELFAYDSIPIMFAKDLNKANGATAFFSHNTPWSGLVLDHKLLNSTQNVGEETAEYRISRDLSRDFISTAINATGVTGKSLGLTNDGWKEILEEYKKNSGDSESDAKLKSNSVADILAYMHCSLHSSFYTADNVKEVRNLFPKTIALYDKFTDKIKERVAELKKHPSHNPFVSPSHTQEITNEAPQIPANDNPSIPTLDLNKLGDFSPKPFTDSEKEAELIKSAKPFIEEALGAEPPCNQFCCRLVMTDSNSKDNFPIALTFRNSAGETREFTVYTGTDNLDEAIELKKALQSHILNHDHICPLYLRLRSDSKNTITREDVIPKTEPTIELFDSEKYYSAKLIFPEENGENLQITIPLGLGYEPRKNSGSKEEAQRRIELLKEHLTELRSAGRSETVGEVLQHLKHGVENSNFGWKVAEVQAIDGYNQEINMGFPAELAQTTMLKSPKIRFEGNSHDHNPAWRLHFTIEVAGLGADGNQKKEFNLSQNLHTTDDTTAQIRAMEAIDSLQGNLTRLKEEHPDLSWKLNEESNKYAGKHLATGQLELRLANGEQLVDPEPQNLFHLIEDMPNPKVDFHIKQTISPRQDGKSKVTFSVQRGTEAEADLVDFKDRIGNKLCRSFEIDANDGKKL